MACISNLSYCKGPDGIGQRCLKCEAIKKSKSSTSASPGANLSGASSPASSSGSTPASAAASYSASSTKNSEGLIDFKNYPFGDSFAKGSYKEAYKVKGNDQFIIIVSTNEKALKTEIGYLREFKNAGIRSVQVIGEVTDVGGGNFAVVMENLKQEGHNSVEIKETRFNMSSAKADIVAKSKVYGLDKVIEQLRLVDVYIQANGGISDLQFFFSEKNGAVLFDPATIRTKEKNCGPASLMAHLQTYVPRPIEARSDV